MTYEYKCLCCNNLWEVEQGIKDPPVNCCPVCKTSSVKRLISGGTGFVLNGGGWSRDNYSTPKS